MVPFLLQINSYLISNTHLKQWPSQTQEPNTAVWSENPNIRKNAHRGVDAFGVLHYSEMTPEQSIACLHSCHLGQLANLVS
jgi:hypothetical protein